MMLRARGFTLLELLIVIVMIAIILSLVLVAVEHTREQARSAHCKNNLRQIAVGFRLFADAHNGRFPDGQKRPWFVDVAERMEPHPDVFRCPSDPLSADMSYHWRDEAITVPEAALAREKIDFVANSGIVLVFDQQPGWHTAGHINAAFVNAATTTMEDRDFEENLLLDVKSGNFSFLE